MKVLFIPKRMVQIVVPALVFLLLVLAVRPAKNEERWLEEIYRPGLAGKLVMIDPGHGGADPGAVAGGVAEKDINLAISRALQQELRQGETESILTRGEKGRLNPDSSMTYAERDRNLVGRKKLAVDNQAHVFVSIHTNSNKDRRAAGGIVYYSADNPFNKVLAEMIQEELNGLYNMKRKVEAANFTVVSNNAMPAVLVEVGFITNPSDRNKLTQSDFRQALAQAVNRGLIKYGAKLPGNNADSSPGRLPDSNKN